MRLRILFQRMAVIVSACAFLISAKEAVAAIAFVQSDSENSGSVSTESIAFGSNNTAGNTIIVAVRQGTPTEIGTVTITDSQGNTYYEVARQASNSDHINFIFAAYNITAGANTVTCTFDSVRTMRWAIHEYSGIQTRGAVDQTAGAQGTSATASSGNITTTHANALLFGMASVNGDETFTAGGSFTDREAVTTKMATADRIVSATGTYSASFSLSGSDTWAALVAAFKESDGLAAWWRFDEGSGGTTADSSGNGWTGTIDGASWTTGRRGGALDFDGTNDAVSIGTVFDIPSIPFTLTAWVNPDDFGNWNKIFSKRDTTVGGNWRLDWELNNADGQVRLLGAVSIYFDYSPPLATWTHLAVVAQSGSTELYVNGTRVDTDGEFTPDTDAAAAVWIGKTGDDEDQFDGKIDDVRVYRRALSASEIQALYVGGKNRNGVLRNGKLNY
jgi:hypothetical protein